jgi:hypothetical protein
MELGKKQLLVRIIKSVFFGEIIYRPFHHHLSLHNGKHVFLSPKKTLEVCHSLNNLKNTLSFSMVSSPIAAPYTFLTQYMYLPFSQFIALYKSISSPETKTW